MIDQRHLQEYLERIRNAASSIDRPVTLMEICGGHTAVVLRYGVRDHLPKNVRLISGPGCPVCVSPQQDIDRAIELARKGVPIATYGDMMRIPGTTQSLEQAKAEGAKVFEVYSTLEVARLREQYADIIFFGAGFETTAPMTGFLLEHKVPVFSVHKSVLPALQAIASERGRIDGFIDPGHVSAITGERIYSSVDAPQVIAGFTLEHILNAIALLLEMIMSKQSGVINGYPEAVSVDGNRKAQAILEKYFKMIDSEWRGLGTIPRSGYEVREDALNARILYQDILGAVQKPKATGCRCGSVLRGELDPSLCPLYKVKCTPTSPLGACMVSAEGSCAISYRYRK